MFRLDDQTIYMTDLAKDIILTRGKSLVFARDDEEKTALHIMALKPFVRKNGVDTKDTPHMGFVHMLLLATVTLESSEEKEKLISTLSVLLFDAIKLGNLEFIKTVVRHKLGQSRLKDLATGQTMLHTAVLFRQNSIIDYLLFTGYDKFNLKYGSRTKVVVLEEQVDKNDNNVLHYAARQIQEVSTSLRPDLQMKREVTWFQDMKEKLGSELTEMRNKDGKTPSDMFHVHHRKLSDEVKDTAKTVANSGMVVAALIVAVAFAAALTTPGGNTNAWFIVFIMANAAALFTSALSIVAFWSIFISSTFKESDEFVTSLYPSLIIGKRLLFISLVTMIIAFAAASFLIFGHKYKWAAYVVTLFGLLTIIYILQLQLSLFGRLLDFFSSRNIKRCLKSIKGMFGFEMESGSVSPKEA